MACEAVMRIGFKSPNSKTSLKHLVAMRANNYIGADGADYIPELVDELISEKSTRFTTPCNEIERERKRLLSIITGMRRALPYLPAHVAREMALKF